MPDVPTGEGEEAWPQPLPDDPKERRCLRCKAAFPSRWNGERICRRCKGSSAWRMGQPLATSSSGGRR